jgi:transcriptional regulator with XRE-family HTH domain
MSRFSHARMKRARERAGISRAEAAAAVCKSLHTVADYEIARRTPTASTIGALADLYDCTVDDFYVSTIG